MALSIDLVVCTALLFVLVEEARRHDDVARAEPAAARALRFLPLLGTALWNALTPRTP